MPRNKSSKLRILLIGGITIAIPAVISIRSASSHSDLLSRIETLETEIAASRPPAQTIAKLTRKVETLRDEIRTSKAPPPKETVISNPTIRQSSEKIEDSILDSWLERTDKLSRYLAQNESLKIPELKYLTAMDWLDVTKFKTIETEADYRVACALLRKTAKNKIVPKICTALLIYRDESGGELPKDVRELLAYSDGAFDQETINRYVMNPSGFLEGLPQSVPQEYILLEKSEPVDPIWNTRAFITERNASGLFGRPDLLLENAKDAFTRFEAEHQRPPSRSQELEPYISKDNIQILPQLFEAITTPVSLGQ